MPSILITGGTSGIGRAAAGAFAAAGWSVGVCGRNPKALADVGAEFGLALAERVDVADPGAVDAFFDKASAAVGHIDVVFNNAGIFNVAETFGDIEIADWQRSIEVNLSGAFYVARAAFRTMRTQLPQGGRIINNGSISAQVPRFGGGAYAAAKAGVSAITKSVSLDGRQFGISCSQIDIGNVLSNPAADPGSGMRQADGSVRPEPTFGLDQLTEALLFMASLPPEANVQNMTLMASHMPFVGRG